MNKSQITVGIHQPNFMPWVGYFYKMLHSDIFVLLDDVSYTKRDWRSRNRIRTKDGGFIQAFQKINNNNKCSSCWCGTKIETNLVYALEFSSLLNCMRYTDG